jgi:hypothetical protein
MPITFGGQHNVMRPFELSAGDFALAAGRRRIAISLLAPILCGGTGQHWVLGSSSIAIDQPFVRQLEGALFLFPVAHVEAEFEAL